MSGIDQKGLVNQVTRIISNHMNIDIKKMNFYTEEDLFKGNILIRVNNQEHIKNLLLKYNILKGTVKMFFNQDTLIGQIDIEEKQLELK